MFSRIRKVMCIFSSAPSRNDTIRCTLLVHSTLYVVTAASWKLTDNQRMWKIDDGFSAALQLFDTLIVIMRWKVV